MAEEPIYDVVIIGGGVVGAAVARELSRFRLRLALAEKEPDVSLGTSCRNSGVIHSGINYKPGTARARLSVLGNSMMDALCAELGVPIKRTGKLTVALDESDIPGLHRLRDQGLANGVPGMELMTNEQMRAIQPGVEGVMGLWTPSAGIISPYGLAIALAEDAAANGADIMLSSELTGAAALPEGGFSLLLREGAARRERRIRTRVLINSAGLRADEVSRMLGIDDSPIWACRGEYYVLDRRLNGELRTLVYQVVRPGSPGIGVHLTPTVDGNILIGPSAEYLPPSEDREDCRATRAVMEELRREGQRLMPGLRAQDFIRNFSGNRPKLTPPEVGGNADFIIEETRVPGFIRLQGIESPGLTSSPAIAAEVRELVARCLSHAARDDKSAALSLVPRDSADMPKKRKRPFAGFFSELPAEERRALIASEPEYGEIICRCERITKKEIRVAIENPLGARGISAIKYRARATMGRCQGGFCLPRIVRMLRDEYGMRPEDFFTSRLGARLFDGAVRGAEEAER